MQSPLSVGFPRAGNVQVSIHFTREENPDFPPFQLPVLSPEEAVCNGLWAESKTESNLPLLASLLAFVAHSGSSREGRSPSGSGVDSLLCNLLHSVNPDELSDWRLGPLLSGKQCRVLVCG